MEAVIEQVLAEITTSVSQVSPGSLKQAQAMLEGASRVFVAGAGRSGLCLRALGMRLMHLGKTAFIVGETTTPGIRAADLLVIASGSGQTSSLIVYAEKARIQGADILLFTTNRTSPLTEFAHHRVLVPAPAYKPVEIEGSFKSIQPMGTLFEQSILVLFDCLILGLMQKDHLDEKSMLARHANLE